MRRPLFSLLLTVTLATPVLADGPAPAPSGSDFPLAPLPELPPLARPAPRPGDLQALDERLEALEQHPVRHPIHPKVDFGFLLDGLDEGAVPAIAQRLDELRQTLAGGAATAMLERARREGGRALKTKDATQTEEDEGDWLQFMLALRRPEDGAWRDLVRVYGMLRMLEAIGTTPAVREMVDAYGAFGELVRIDLQRSLERLGDKAVPALVEARQHDARKVRDWSSRLLDALGRAIPGESIGNATAASLPDLLLAFGRVRDVDAARVVLSFVASERAQVREAARQALVAIGEAAVWHVRDAYETVTGDKPPRSWEYKRLLQELYRVHDRAGLSAVAAQTEQGVELARKGDHAAAVALFDQVLARAPLADRRPDMIASYAAHATTVEREGKLEDALLVLRKALRLNPPSEEAARLESRVATLEGRMLAERDTPDAFLLKRATELDPDNAEARERLARVGVRGDSPGGRLVRRLAAAAVAVVALALAFVWRRRRHPPDSKAAAPTTSESEPQTDETGAPAPGSPESPASDPSESD